ncbi:MAG: leucyl aminopeptidase [Myxococcota bacterium]
MNVRFPSEPLSSLAADALAIGVPSDFSGPVTALDEALGGQLISWLKSQEFKGSAASIQVVPTMGRIGPANVIVVGIGDGSPEAWRRAVGRAGREARSMRVETLSFDFSNAAGRDHADLIEALQAGNYVWEQYKPEEQRKPSVSTLQIGGTSLADDALATIQTRVKWQNFARDLVNLPPADLFPESLAAKAQQLAALPGVELEVWDFERCKAEGCVGIVAVGQGSERPGCLIWARYRPETVKHHVALVGKGVTFDAGGYSLKPSSAMQTMRCDMGGSAVMLAATGAIAELGLPIAVDCLVGAVENLVSGNAFKLGDILRYTNGVTVEIHNTDAEGRLVLADCLIRASQVDGVQTIIDAATLTGAAVVAVGSQFSGLFTHDEGLAGELKAAADQTGEGLWRLPLHGPYKELLRSDYAQIKNVGSREAGATTAALFLEHFVGEGKRWAHLDIAGPAFLDKASSKYAPGGTGEMVRSLVSWAATQAG